MTARATKTAEAVLDRLPHLTGPELAAEWRARFGLGMPPAMPDRLARLALAHALQAGSRTPDPAAGRTRRRRVGGGQASPSRRPGGAVLTPGTVLVRDWGGGTHRVEVLDDGRFAWAGQRWRSLSAIAREITGTRRSGPAFFGLTGDGGDGTA